MTIRRMEEVHTDEDLNAFLDDFKQAGMTPSGIAFALTLGISYLKQCDQVTQHCLVAYMNSMGQRTSENDEKPN